MERDFQSYWMNLNWQTFLLDVHCSSLGIWPLFLVGNLESRDICAIAFPNSRSKRKSVARWFLLLLLLLFFQHYEKTLFLVKLRKMHCANSCKIVSVERNWKGTLLILNWQSFLCRNLTHFLQEISRYIFAIAAFQREPFT